MQPTYLDDSKISGKIFFFKRGGEWCYTIFINIMVTTIVAAAAEEEEEEEEI